MKIQLLSDLHLEHAPCDILSQQADIVVLAGDIGIGSEGLLWAKKNTNVPVLYVAGNHEYHDATLSMQEHQIIMKQCVQHSHVHFLDNAVFQLDGIRFIGTTLWSDLSTMSQALSCDTDGIVMDFYAGDQGDEMLCFDRDVAQALFEKNKQWLSDTLATPFAGSTVVVSHHAPSLQSLDPSFIGNMWNPCFMSDLSALMGSSVDLWLHGHTHHSFDYRLKGTRVVCNPRGYPSLNGTWENPSFDPALLIQL